MVKIRSGCFETNSSSTHAMCLDTTNKYPKYTDEHLEAFTDVVYPFTDDDSFPNDPHVFFELKDKIRYFWTIFVRDYFGCLDTAQKDFICKLQKLVPQASFAYRFPHYKDDGWMFVSDNAKYMEDAQYVLDDESNSVANWSIDKLKDFLLNGVILFGDRDNYNPILMESVIDLFIRDNNLKVINSYSG